MDDLRVLAEVDKPDIIALCETWLGEEVRPSEVALPEFRSYRLNRTRRGGGVLLYIRECLGPVRCIFDNDNAEFISAAVSTAAGPVWIGLYCRPPSSLHSLTELEAVFAKQNLAIYSHAILLGDFNIDLLHHDNLLSLELIGVTSIFGLLHIITEATRTTTSSRSLIDHLYASSSSLIHSSCVLPLLGSSDHSSIEICLNVAKPHRFHPKCRV